MNGWMGERAKTKVSEIPVATRRRLVCLQLPELAVRVLSLSLSWRLETSISVATNQNFPPITRRAARDRLFNPCSHFGPLADANDAIAVYSLVAASGEPSILQILAYLSLAIVETHRRRIKRLSRGN